MTVEISGKIQEKVMEDFLEFFCKKLKKKGEYSFASIAEIYGKLQEENFEVLKELHAKKPNEMATELFDVAIVALWGAMSIEAWKE